MKVTVTYIYPMNGAAEHGERALRFLSTYHAHHPGMEHDTAIICNGHAPTEEAGFLFGSMPNCTLYYHDDSGLDIGAFQMAARTIPCDLMIFFGGNTYLKRAGWLARMVDAWQRHGDTLYGAMGNRGAAAVGVQPHIRTTGFWMSPKLLNKYPVRVTDTGRGGQRYEFEHGANCLTTWIKRQGKLPYVVAWDGEYLEAAWDLIPNGFHRGDQSNLLCGDRLTMPPYHPCE